MKKTILRTILLVLLTLGCSIVIHIELFNDRGWDSAFVWFLTIIAWFAFVCFYGIGYGLGYTDHKLDDMEEKAKREAIERWRESRIANNHQKEEGK